jgi:hypothetical protein
MLRFGNIIVSTLSRSSAGWSRRPIGERSCTGGPIRPQAQGTVGERHNVTTDWLETFFSYAALGLIVGFGYYLAMAMNANLVAKGVSRRAVMVIDGMRVLAAIAFFAWLASTGTVPVLSAFVGFLCGRLLAMQLFERAS